MTHAYAVGDVVVLAIQRGARRSRVRCPVVGVGRRRICVRIADLRVWVNPVRVMPATTPGRRAV